MIVCPSIGTIMKSIVIDLLFDLQLSDEKPTLGVILSLYIGLCPLILTELLLNIVSATNSKVIQYQ